MANIRSVSLSPEADAMVEEKSKLGFNFSEFVDQAVKKSFGNLEYLELQENECLNKLNDIRKQKELLIKYAAREDTERRINGEEERKFLAESAKILKKDPNYLLGRVKFYNNLFGANINAAEFLQKIDML